MPESDFTCKYALSPAEVDAAREWGAAFGRRVLEMGRMRATEDTD